MAKCLKYKGGINMFDDVSNLERNAIMIALSTITDGIKFTKEKDRTDSYPPIYTIKSDDDKINIILDMEERESDTFENFRRVVKYAFNKHNFVATDMYSDMDVINNVAKLFNGLKLNLKTEQNKIQEQNLEDEIIYTQFHRNYPIIRTKLVSYLYEGKNLSPVESMSIILARLLVDNMLDDEDVFLDGEELMIFFMTNFILHGAFPQIFESDEKNIYNLCKNILTIPDDKQ